MDDESLRAAQHAELGGGAQGSGLGGAIGFFYALFNLGLMFWWGYGGFGNAYPQLKNSPITQLGCYYLVALFLVQVVLFPCSPRTRRSALIGYFSPWALLVLVAPAGVLLWAAVPLGGFALNYLLEMARTTLRSAPNKDST